MSIEISRRYRIDALLGEGATCRVYAAVDHERDDAPVAVKVAKDALATTDRLLASEFALLFRIRHPHLPRAFDIGRLPRPQPLPEHLPAARFLVLERAPGVRSATWAAGKAPELIAAVGAQIAAAVAGLHARGICHGDIKPDNILVDGGALPHATLLDFNLATQGTQSGVSGTLRYMAPEALAGARSSAADIYSLAASLVEMLSGAPPGGHHGAELVAPHFADLIAAMSHPDPSKRADAATAFALLAAVAAPPTRAHLDRLQNGVELVGPFGLAPSVTAAIDHGLAARTAGCRVVKLSGPKGSGKTAALEQATVSAALAGYEVAGGVRPGQLGRLAAIEDLCAELEGRPRPQETPPAAAALTGDWDQISALADRLTALTTNAGLALIFDDVAPDAPLVRLATFLERMGEAGPKITWFVATTAGGDDGVRLPPLDPEGVRRLLTIARPLRPHDLEAAEALAAASGGSPGTVTALLEAFKGDLLLAAARDGRLRRADVLTASARSRLAELPAAVRRAVLAVALLDPPVPIEVLKKIPSVRTALTPAALDRAVDLGLLTRRTVRGIATLAVPGEVLRQALLETADTELVRQVASSLAGADDLTARAAEIGRLWVRLSEPTKAALPLVAGARQAAAERRTLDALELYAAAVATHALDPQTDAAAALESGRLLHLLGRYDEAVAHFDRAASHPESRTGKAEALIARGRYRDAAALLTTGRGVEGEDRGLVEAMLARAQLLAGDDAAATAAVRAARARELPHPRAVELATVEALAASHAGDHARAKDLLEEALGTAERHGDAALVDTTRANLALALHKMGDQAGALQCYAASLDAARARRDLPRQLLRLVNLAALRQEQGSFAAALQGYDEAWTLSLLIDGRREMARIGLNWANLLCWLGDTDAALKACEQAQAVAAAAGLGTETAYLRLVQAEILLARGDSGGAETALAAAVALLTEQHDRAGQAEAAAVKAEIALYRRDAARTRAAADEAVSAARAVGRDRIEAYALLWRAMADLEEPTASAALAVQAAVQAGNIADKRRDFDLGWLAHATASRLHARVGRGDEAQFHAVRARQLVQKAKERLSARFEKSYGAVWYRRELWALTQQAAGAPPDQLGRDVDRLLAINRELAQDHDPERLLERVIDAAIALSGAERGFIVLKTDGGTDLAVRAARNIDRETLETGALNISRSIAGEAMATGAPVTSINAADDDRFREFLSVHNLRLRSVLCLPLNSQRGALGALYLDNRYRVNAFSAADVAILSALGDQAAIALDNARLVSELSARSRELEQSRAEIEALNQTLQGELQARALELAHARLQAHLPAADKGRHGMIGRSAQMREVFRVIDRVADKIVPVTILGESGTGKELVARAIHQASPRAAAPLVSVNCAAIPAELVESELFGHERGAFTGAVRTKPGLFEIASTGTIFLDEIGDMPLTMQVKLLRVIQQREFRRVGGTEHIKTDARVLSASNRDLEAMVKANTFREDLWYRLNVVEVKLPPLRARREDLPLLVDELLTRHGGDPKPRFSRAALALLIDHEWPGNVRELENEIQRAVALAEGQEITVDNLSAKVRGAAGGAADADDLSLKARVDRFEREVIKSTLALHDGRVAAAADAMGLTRAGLYKKLHKYSLKADKD
ncbi:MAG: sigma 54-interacting transcriptional regulator [Deltaproteobacteria bacterium]|nr:sigma 54-interacting transcriptional regulator [Deltaproteobacteria bacterium]